MADNYADVLTQMRAAGLQLDSLDIGRFRRCKVEGSREKPGWYKLHELTLDNGRAVIVGSFGVWQGNEQNPQKIEIRREDISTEQSASLRKRLAEDRKRAERERQADADKAAARAKAAWDKCSPTGESSYLKAKGVGAHGVRFSPSGALAIPMINAGGQLRGLQIIRSRAQAEADGKRTKDFWPYGVEMRGTFHLMGSPSAGLVIVTEGYATGASIFEAMTLPVAVCWSAANIGPVCVALRKRYKGVRILIAADDDSLQKCRACKGPVLLADHPTICPSCGEEHRAKNAGVSAASAAALEVGGAYVAPVFADEDRRRQQFLEHGHKLTDFNDLHAVEGLYLAALQISAKLDALGWSVRRTVDAGASTTGGGGSAAKLRPFENLDELMDRFALVYGQGGEVFDRQEHMLLAIGDMRDACCMRELHRAWMEHPDRDIVRKAEVGFDPSCTDPTITCNLWGGWPTEPRAGRCEKLLELLEHMCSGETANRRALYTWCLRWLAYPIQHPGAKMKTTIVVHGPQGTGKNLFFEAVMGIYGAYGRVIDQDAIEDRFNDWASRKLFLIADEVVARQELYKVKNKLKSFITGDWIRINPKGRSAYDERNCCNLVFLSNEAVPVVLEEGDRRYAVIWTPTKLDADFYREVLAELRDGGVAALHHYLAHLDLGDFGPGTPPPVTEAKGQLLALSLDNTVRFLVDLHAGDIAPVEARPCRTTDLYSLYRAWCHRTGQRPAPMHKLIDQVRRRHAAPQIRQRMVDDYGGLVQATIVAIGKEREPPPGAPAYEWWAQQINAFRAAVSDYQKAAEGAHA